MDFSGLKILVLGDVMLDHYIFGEISRISPEAPVPVLRQQRRLSVPGGAANVARNLAHLGVDCSLVGLIGRDEPGQELESRLAELGIRAALVQSSSRRTTCKTRVLAQGQQVLRIDEEDDRPPDAAEFADLSARIASLDEDFAAVIISDYLKGVLLSDARGQNLCQTVIDRARAKGIPVLVDPKGLDWERYRNATCVTPNLPEFSQVCGSPVCDLDLEQRDLAAKAICQKYAFGHLLLTLGPRGMQLCTPGHAPAVLSAHAREVADVSGAGDTVIASLSACIAKGLSFAESAAIANAAAGVVVGKRGTAPISIGELNAVLTRDEANPKLYSLDSLRKILVEWRNRGESVVFTNGCFDLLHPGHISLLKQCAALGDRLVVGLNSDLSVRRLKGPARPIQDELSRAMLLGAIHGVDAVCIFDEDTPAKLIEAVRPDVLVKGSDYQLTNVIGADFVQSYGGRVELVSLVDGVSTTELVRRMQPQKGGES